MAKLLSVVQPLPPITGSAKYQAALNPVLQRLADRVPANLILPTSTIQNPPKNVTSVPRECGLLTAEEIDITESYDATALAEAIASRKLSAVQVTVAFSKRAIIAHQLTACLSEWFMDEAVARAKELDDHLASTGRTVGPLHGVPISVKAHLAMAGHWSIRGFLATIHKDDIDCQIIRIIREAGAVFFCKTNQPQAIMHLESTSPLGRVLNPHNVHLSAGGSSGGEAALIAMRGSVLGVGSDIGGSIRGPSAFCGIYGFKTTSYTLPTKDIVERGASVEFNILPAAGPMSKSLRDMDLFMSVVLGAKPWLEDPRLVPLPWSGLSYQGENGQASRPLKIGFMMHDGAIMPQPPVISALEWARSRLEGTDPDRFLVKSFAPYRASEAVRNIRLAYWHDGGKAVRDALALTDEPMLPMTEWILREAVAAFGNRDKDTELLLSEVYAQRRERDEFRNKFAEHWNAQDVDLLICPAFVGPACAHETAWYWNYTAFWNYVDYPGAVIPTPIVTGDKKVKKEYESAEPLSAECKHVRQLWEAGDFEGAPLNLQVIARRYHDNDLFRGLAALKDVLDLS